MVLLDEKMMYPQGPPPSYYEVVPVYTTSTAAAPVRKYPPRLGDLPSHVLLQIVYDTFPQDDGYHDGESKLERQKEVLHWLVTSLRLVNRAHYVASMHILRATYHPAYESLVRAPYSSNPFPRRDSDSAPPDPDTHTSIFSPHRELATLDTFIALLAYEDMMLDSTELYLTREEAYKDLFDLSQPRSRLEDLVREMGVEDGIITDSTCPEPERVPPCSDQSNPPSPNEHLAPLRAPESPSSSPRRTSFSFSALKTSIRNRLSSTPPPALSTVPDDLIPRPFPLTPEAAPRIPHSGRRLYVRPVPFSVVSVAFTPRRVGLVLSSAGPSSQFGGSEYGTLTLSVAGPTGPGGKRKTVAEVNRERNEPLETCARMLVRALRTWLEEDQA
ncbi:hypothetical protein CYLTODRAFT_424547 [Cylindrobasidium torrendii FP15055 ss-10]|uniref:Uncharacterized protein n=1 Tax=Cylindrobasidium torrendii FP15055 ss-10 TaxID=1314674 RepID=A0A0D7B4W2_9AGAR|nr:hypothetical protein CYLTODRAFT_424547 [Cylindrobasidium torrendii FP15055 ss-10]